MSKAFDRLMGPQRLWREALATLWAPATPHALHAVPAPGARIDPGKTVIKVQLCDSTITLVVEEFGQGGACFINLHENEQTSVAAARAVLSTSPGRLVRLCSRGRRHVVFWNGWRPHAFDPNRIFSDAGLQQTLLQFASLTDAAFDAVRALRTQLLELLVVPNRAPVVALHNNRGCGYTVLEYGVGERYAGDCAARFVGNAAAPEDFLVVTHASWFERLRALGFNVVLQSPTAHDDGSLSIWFQRSGRIYINAEARHGRLAAQREMLGAIGVIGAIGATGAIGAMASIGALGSDTPP